MPITPVLRWIDAPTRWRRLTALAGCLVTSLVAATMVAPPVAAQAREDRRTALMRSGPIAGTVSMRAMVNDRYVVAESAGSAPLIANRAVAGAWEKFDLVPAGGSDIHLRARANGLWVTAEAGGAAPLISNRSIAGPWETFQLIDNGDGTSSLRARANGKIVTAEAAGTAPLIANRTSIGPWEKFQLVGAGAPAEDTSGGGARTYPLHSRIVTTTFWVGEIFDPSASDGSQMISTYDDDWYARYGGCDGVNRGSGARRCQTEQRFAGNGFFPTSMTPRQNPFYLDLPYDDVNDRNGFASRGRVIPWANDPGYAGQGKNQNFSMMKNRWVRIARGAQVCYGQVQDAGPADGDNGGRYDDAAYVFGANDVRPLNRAFGGAGMDVSPALTGCLSLPDLDGISPADLTWQFVEASQVPRGPWTQVVTTSQVNGAPGSPEYVNSITPR